MSARATEPRAGQAADWDPDLYRTFEAERTRPALDLLAQIRVDRARFVADLGCGPGNSTELLARRFDGARLLGLDASDAMLASARQRLPNAEFELGDAATWTPDQPPDVIFANAVLQWVPDHAGLMPRLLGLLAPGGVLAVQMPDNLDEASHRLMREVAQSGPWRDRIGEAGSARAKARLPAAAYYDLLAPIAAETDVWRTVYHHPMPDAAAIVTWVRATGLRPFLDPLSETERLDFLARYETLIDAAYPARADGRRLLAFPRLFITARRRDENA